VQHGIKRSRFVPTRDRLVELGLVEIALEGAVARFDPSHYRLTYLLHKIESISGAPSYVQAQHDWVDVELAILDGRYKLSPPQHKAPSRNRRRKTPVMVDEPPIINPGHLPAS
jgi:hypothetical protein